MSYFSNNLKKLRESQKITKQALAEKINVNISTVSRWENDEMGVTVDNAYDVANFFNVSIADLTGKDLNIDNGIVVDTQPIETSSIPVLGSVHAGKPIEAQEDIMEYIDIPKKWTLGGKEFYGLYIKGDSMSPKYEENDIVIFEHCEDMEAANHRDCVVMVDGFDATFKNFTLNQNGITLVPLNMQNSDNYQPTFYSIEQIQELPVKVIGIAREKRTRL